MGDDDTVDMLYFADWVVSLARKHHNWPTDVSARLCADAIDSLVGGDHDAAIDKALRSLRVRVGADHEDYRRAAKAVAEVRQRREAVTSRPASPAAAAPHEPRP